APAPGELPRRRNRRGAREAAVERTLRAPRPAPPDGSWTPEAARASIASVVSGSRRGRAALEPTTPMPDDTDHEGGRS
ncbi:ATP-binding protein, partial [Streptomyces sp. NPDC059881]